MKLEIELNGKRMEVRESLFRCFSGRRFVQDVEYHGPVYFYQSNQINDGPRECKCDCCQSFVKQETEETKK